VVPGESQGLGVDRPVLQAVEERAGNVMPGNELQRDQVIRFRAVELAVVRDDVHLLDPHAVGRHQLLEVRAYAILPEQLEPEGRAPAERLPLVRDIGRNDLVEDGDVVREEELQVLLIDLIDLLDFARTDQFHGVTAFVIGLFLLLLLVFRLTRMACGSEKPL